MTAELDLCVNPGVWMTGWNRDRAPQIVQRLARIGYRRVMVVLRDPSVFEGDGIRELVEGAGLGVVTNTNQVAGQDISSDDADARERGVARLRRAIALSAELGSDQLTGILYGPLGSRGPVAGQTFDRTAKILGDLAEEAAAIGVRLLCEVVNRYETAMMNTAADGMDFVQRSGSERLGLHLDLFHMNIEEDDIVAAISDALPRLGYLEMEQNHRGELHRGHIPVVAILEGAIGAGYQGRFGLEAFTASAIEPAHAAGLSIWRDVLETDTRIAEDAYEVLKAVSSGIRS
ncbi:MAG: sugar phosphate isomerase/epimerase [Naasia sp.]|uniref:sugar phosphate isomerase/epimerase family protein n=1 Tax=Naasia sp. TaxID=2546198 RepID=UPI002605CA93|nr:sugar phosphate isomerase/epimerase family protein [Naasia sp.]MCU1569965.1 sugar phosphate isomerase/epimerase [Naasia sp.]